MTQKQAAIDYNTGIGRDVQNSFWTGAAGGGTLAGAMALYKYLKSQQEKHFAPPSKPSIDQIALEAEIPRSFMKKLPKEEKKSSINLNDAVPYLLPLAGAAGGAALGRYTAPNKKEKNKRTLAGAALGGLGGAGLSLMGTDAGARALARPINAFQGWRLGENLGLRNNDGATVENPADIQSHDSFSGAARMAAKILAGVGGGAGAFYGVNKLLDNSDAKREDREDAVEKSRKNYFKDLLSKESEDGKALTKIAQLVKKSEDGYENPHGTSWWNPATYAGLATDIFAYPAALGALGAGGLASYYMYNKTRANSKEQQLAHARRHYNRMRPMRNVWVDPQELAAVKEIVEAEKA